MNKTTGRISELPTNFTGLHFELLDYVVLVVLLLVSIGIGIYFGYFDGKAKTMDEYLLGGRKMKAIPIGISLVASQMSAISVVAVPAEMYAFGSHYMLMTVPTMIIAVLILNYVIVPVFYNNNLDNCYTYLEMRFSKSVRNLVTFAFLITALLYLPIGSYIAALVMSSVTGLNIHALNGVVSAVCIAYTIMGGVKAVVWTDVLQAFVMVISAGTVIVFGVIRIGGINEVYQKNIGQRLLLPPTTLDLETRQTFWNLLLGYTFMWMAHCGLNQVTVQRIVTLPNVKQARSAMYFVGAGIIYITTTNSFIGSLMYAHYFDCDPVKSGRVSKADKMMPHFVHEMVGHIDGMAGLFVSSVLSASLSTVAANLNTIAGIIYKDYLSKIKRIHHTEAIARYFMYSIILVVGSYSVAMGLILENHDSMYQILMMVMGLAQGAVCGVFLLGMLYPKANDKAALWGTLVSMIAISLLIVGSQIEVAKGWSYKPLPTSIDGCIVGNLTMTIQNKSTKTPSNGSFSIFKTSFLWNTVFGTIIVWLVAVPLSYISGPENMENLNVNLISPIARCLVPTRIRRIELKQYSGKEKPLENTENEEKTYIVETADLVITNRRN